MRHAWIPMSVVLAIMAATAMSQSPAPSGEPVKVGVILPLSGSLTAYGKGASDGIQQRVKEINDAGGVAGHKIDLVVEDNRGSAQDSRAAYRKLTDVDKVAAVIGPLTSTNALAMKIEVAKSKVPVITPTATNDSITARTQHIFRTCFNDSFQGQVIATYALNSLKLKKAAVMVDKSSDYSKGLTANFKKAFEAGGGKVVAEESYQQGDADFGPQLAKIKSSGAEILFVPGYPPEVPKIISQAMVVGFAGRLCGADGWDNEAVLQNSGDNIVGCFLVGAFSPEDKRESVQKFVEVMKAATKRTPGTFEALGYDSVTLLAEAIKAKGAGREQIREGLAGLKGVDAITGKISITSSGDAEKDAVILKVEKAGDKYAAKYVETVGPK